MLANDCFLLERGSLPSSTLICTTYRPRIIEAGAEQFIIVIGKMKEAGNRSTVISIQQHKPTIENCFSF